MTSANIVIVTDGRSQATCLIIRRLDGLIPDSSNLYVEGSQIAPDTVMAV